MAFLTKNKFLLLFFISLFLFPAGMVAQKLNSSSELIKIYREYRIVQQKKSDWVDSIDNWTGKFHTIMINIGDTLGKPVYSKKEIIKLLGKPDEIICKNSNENTTYLYYIINNKPITEIRKNEEYLVYKWRGYRDFLYFYIRNGKVRCSEFYYSWE